MTLKKKKNLTLKASHAPPLHPTPHAIGPHQYSVYEINKKLKLK
jgi:hypothetical protein